jgi:hypothetical protein
MSYLLPFTAAVPVSLSRQNSRSSSLERIRRVLSRQTTYTQYNEAGVDIILRTPPVGAPSRKGSWLGKPRSERRQSCRRVNSRRDWSGELEESEYHLPFPAAEDETQQVHRPNGRRMVSFQDDVNGGLPTLDTTLSQGLMIDMEESPVEDEFGRDESAAGTESSGVESVDTDYSAGSEWTALSEEAEGIEMMF